MIFNKKTVIEFRAVRQVLDEPVTWNSSDGAACLKYIQRTVNSELMELLVFASEGVVI